MKTKKERILLFLNVLQALALLAVFAVFILHYFILPRGGTKSELSFDASGWPEEKAVFASSNAWFNEREMLFMNYHTAPVDLCCLGDSITQKFEWQDAFPDMRVANRGIGSDTTEGILSRLDSVELLQPQVISIMAGINDLGQGRTSESIIETYQQIIDELQEKLPDCELIVNSVLPVTEESDVSNDSIIETNTLLEELCDAENVIYIDLYQSFADENGFLREEYALDSVHLNAQGYEIWLTELGQEINA